MGLLKTILGILQAMLGLGQKVAEEVHDRGERQAGQAQQRAEDLQVAVDAGQRMQQAGARRHDSDATIGRLDDGTF